MNMKKMAGALLMALLCLMTLASAHGEEAKDLSKKCKYKISSGSKIQRLYDGSYTKPFSTLKQADPYVQVTTPEGKPCYGLFIRWPYAQPPAWELQQYEAETDSWATVKKGGEKPFAHEYIEVPGLERLRIMIPSTEKVSLKIAELTVLGEGELPKDVQVWEPTPQKADLLLLSAHPDDEYIFMGGTIPYYAGELKKDVVVCYMTYASDLRRTELLNGLWHAGLRTYPVLGEFKDKYTNKLKAAYDLWGEKESQDFLTGVIKTYQPEVMVTHDIDGEYGHGAHRLCADAAQVCVKAAQEGEKPWTVKKLYLHLYDENQIKLDWRQPLEAFEGKTALKVAKEAFKFHKSQQGGSVKYRGKKYVFEVKDSGWFDNSLYGLAHTTVGLDEQKNDFFENIGE